MGTPDSRCEHRGSDDGRRLAANFAYPPGWLEPMTLVAGDEHVLGADMSFTVEPNLALPDEGFGLKMGETVLCTPDGPEPLTDFDHTLHVLDC